MWKKNRTSWPYRSQQFNNDEELKITNEWWNWIINDIDASAWWIPKSVKDYSIFHALFTHDVNGFVWKWIEDWVENLDLSTSTRILSTNWWLELKTTATNWSITELRSFRSPRYQPNRGHLFSNTIMYPDAETIWATLQFWLWYESWWDIYTGIFFEITDAKIYIVVRNAWIDREMTDITSIITDELWLSISDFVNWQLYDIQYQWRWVWDFFFFINLKLIYRVNLLWILTNVTIENPQLPCFYRIKNTTAWSIISVKSWCVDITSEWWQSWGLTDASYPTNWIVTIPNDLNKHALLIFRVSENYKWKLNTRNFRLLRLTATPFGKDMNIGFAITRDSTAIWWTLWDTVFSQVNPYSSLDFIDMSINTETEVSFDFTKATNLYQASSVAGNTHTADEPNKDLDLYLSWWDIITLFVKNIKSWTWWEAEWLVEFGEEI